MAMIVCSPKVGLLKWTGANFTEIQSWMPVGSNFPGPVTCVNNSGTLAIDGPCTAGGTTLTVPNGAYIYFGFMDDNTPFPYLVQYGTGQFQQATSDLTSIGTAAIPALILGASTTVDVTLKTPMPDTSFSAFAAVIGSTSIIAGLSVTSTTILNAATVRVGVQNVGVATLSGQLLVWAIHS